MWLQAATPPRERLPLLGEGLAVQEQCPWAARRSASATSQTHPLLPTLSEALPLPCTPYSASSTLYYKTLSQLSLQRSL